MKHSQAGVSCPTGAEISGKFREMLKSLQRQVPSCTALTPQHRLVSEINLPSHLRTTPCNAFRCHCCILTEMYPDSYFPGSITKTKTTSITRGEIFRQLEETVTTVWTLGHLFLQETTQKLPSTG